MIYPPKDVGFSTSTGAPKVRDGRVGDYLHELSEDVIAEMDAIWKEEIDAKFSIASYQDLGSLLRQESEPTIPL